MVAACSLIQFTQVRASLLGLGQVLLFGCDRVLSRILGYQNHAPPAFLGPESAQSVQRVSVCVCVATFTLSGGTPLVSPPCLLYAT